MSVLGRIALGKRALSDRPIMLFAVVLAAGIVAPFAFYPVFLMNVLCFALFASASIFLLATPVSCRLDTRHSSAVPDM